MQSYKSTTAFSNHINSVSPGLSLPNEYFYVQPRQGNTGIDLQARKNDETIMAGRVRKGARCCTWIKEISLC